MLRQHAKQILNLYNYFDGLVMTDKNGTIEYYQTYRPEINPMQEKDILGKNILDVYPGLNSESSSIMRVLRTGKPIYNEYQLLRTFRGDVLQVVNTTMPIRDDNFEIIGAIDISRYIDPSYERQDINVALPEEKKKSELYYTDDIITASPSIEEIKDRIPMIAETDSSVLIYGETGTGKELVAQSIHTSGARKDKPFISQNCAAIPSNLLESILFGTTKGSFTGAENKPGLFEIANGGTIFLDELNSMELSVQSKLLKAIEEKKVTRLGSYKPISFDVKIISAINIEPLQCLVENKIREDLFYRLSVVQISIPPLRERKEDLWILTDHFIKMYNQKMDRHILGLDDEVKKVFEMHRWRGNVRELRHVIEGAFNVSKDLYIHVKDLPNYITTQSSIIFSEYGLPDLHATPPSVPTIPSGNGAMTLDEMTKNFERSVIEKTLTSTKNASEAARRLGLSRQALNYKLEKYNLK